MRKISLALCLLLLSGCAGLTTGWNSGSEYTDDPYSRSDFDELLTFGANMANIPPTSRVKVCRTLLNHPNNPAGEGIYLHLMVGRLLSDACGEISKILEGVGAIPPGSLADKRMQKLVAIDTEALKRLQAVSTKLNSLERRQKALQSKKVSGTKKNASTSKKNSGESMNNETQLLREKLEAIRSMEKHLDESGDSN
jgi:hypothetical protein